MEEPIPTRSAPGRVSWLVWITLCASHWSLSSHARAEEISFDEALDLGALNPAVSSAREVLRARESGDEEIGGTAAQTSLVVMPGALVRLKNDIREFNPYEMQATVTQGWNLGNLGGARRDAAMKERGVLTADVRVRALRARLEAARYWIDLATLAEVAETVDARIEEAEALVGHAERALRSGEGTAQPVAEARAMLAQLRQRRLDLEGEEFAVATRLALAVGRAPSAKPLRTKGDPPNPSLPDVAEIRPQIDDIDAAPDVVVEQLRETAAHARAVEASAQYAPVLTLGAQTEHSAFGTWSLFAVSGVVFHGFGQSRRWTSLAEAEAVGARADTVSARLRVRAELEEALHELIHTASVQKLLDEETVPALQGLVASRARAVALGEESRFALIEARDRELAAVEAAQRARGANTWARVQMWLLLAELARGESQP